MPVGPACVFQAVASYTNGSLLSVVSANPVSATNSIVFNAVRTGNADSSFNTFNGTFVAPAKGLYQFDVAISAAAKAATTITVNLVVDGNVINTQSKNAATGDVINIDFSSIVSLNQASSVFVSWNATGAAGNANLQTAIYPSASNTWFQGKSLF